MSAEVIQFTLRRGDGEQAGVCAHCLARRLNVTDFSVYGLGKWCDGCLPVLIEAAKSLSTGAAAG
jgi:hypothetical protein